MSLLSPSQLVLAATGLPPEGSDTCDERHTGLGCAVCGVGLVTGEAVDALALPPSFTNHSSLAHPGQSWRCGACTAVMTRSVFQMGASSVLVSREGIFPIARKEHRSWAFLTPPEPPFIVAVQNAQQQHVIWRSPVTLSKDLILVRVGEQIVKIRRPLLLQACEEAKLIQSVKKEKGRPIKDGIDNPLVGDWKLQSSSGGQLKNFVYKLLNEQIVTSSQIPALLSLNAGEAWALGAALYDHPVKPNSIASTII